MMELMRAGTGRITKRDVVITVLLTALGVALMVENVADPPPRPADEQAAIHIGSLLPYAAAIPLFLLVTVPLLWRRAAPLAAVSAAFAGLLVNDLLVGTEVVRCGVLLPTAFLFAFAIGAQLERGPALFGLGLTLAFMAVDLSVEFGGEPFSLVFVVIAVAIWGIGRIVRSRQAMAVELEARTAQLRDARDERARLEVASDRARLSGELDELLQRRLGDLARLADEGANGNGARATDTLVDIERESRQTLEEMRELVGVLRHDTSETPTAPQPTLTHLEAMLVRAKGSNAQLTVEGNPRVLPAGVELSAYRIVEHLLDAMEDAPDVQVRVEFRNDSLGLDVSGPARRDAKAAIDRARERARLQKGTLEATTRGRRAEAVVRLPVLAGG
jgi:hypothetical protein